MSDEGVVEIAGNPNTDLEVVKRLAEDKDPLVKKAALENLERRGVKND